MIGSTFGLFLGNMLPLDSFGGTRETTGNLVGHPQVIDGDTLVLNSVRIRLSGIDAPEMAQVCFDEFHRPYSCGQKAKQALIQMVSFGSTRCIGDAYDIYGRLIGTCFVSERNVNKEMVQRGWAMAYTKYSLRYSLDELNARISDRGLWRGEFESPWNWRRRH
jgi:endonuclease YncB( thermonuclease family)